jgi:hypothetical protein
MAPGTLYDPVPGSRCHAPMRCLDRHRAVVVPNAKSSPLTCSVQTASHDWSSLFYWTGSTRIGFLQKVGTLPPPRFRLAPGAGRRARAPRQGRAC